MAKTELIFAVIAAISILCSWITLYLSMREHIRTQETVHDLSTAIDGIRTHIDSLVIDLKEDIIDVDDRMTEAGLETMKIRTDDHDRAIDSIRRDLLDLQVISGTLPGKASTMHDDVENALQELKALQSNYLETRAIVDNTKAQMEKLAEAYASLRFTSMEIEHIRDKLEELNADKATV